MSGGPVVVVAGLVRAFESLGISYVVGGSFASSIYGIPRATQDVDVVADIRAEQVDPLARALSGEFYVDAQMVRDAVRGRTSFNVLHETTMFKADIFVSPDDDWSRERLRRGRAESFETPQGRLAVRFSTPEDTLLHKLVWYRLGNEVSDRQWGDAVGLLKIQKDHLDDGYLNRWAPVLGVEELLNRARRSARG